jgi:hypothetical protein
MRTEVALFGDRKRVDVRTQRQHRTARLADETTHDARLRRSRNLETAERRQRLFDETSGLVLLE